MDGVCSQTASFLHEWYVLPLCNIFRCGDATLPNLHTYDSALHHS